MKVKQKKCKGTGKAKSHGCNEIKLAFKYGLCKTCFYVWLYNTPNGKEMLSKTILRAKNKVKKDKVVKRKYIKWQDKEFKDMKTYIQFEICNPYIKWRDKIKFGKCISSNCAIVDAGHYYSISSSPQLRFNIMNIHGQNWSDNRYNAGNLPAYKEGIISRHGFKYFEKLEKLKRDSNEKYLDKFELIRIGKTYEYLFKREILCFDHAEFENYKEIINK